MSWQHLAFSLLSEALTKADAEMDTPVSTVGAQSTSSNTRLMKLEQRTDRIALTTMAMLSLLSERLGITEQEIEDRIGELDLADGQRDGRVRAVALDCPSCGRKVTKRHSKCMYCGESVSPGTRSL